MSSSRYHIEAGLLERVDALAKKRGLSRARIVAHSLEALLGSKQQ